MKGLEIAKAFFFEWGLPFIEREFPGLKERIAVGCFGGSQALGADDLLSQDHAWGPAFHIYLEGDYEIDDREIVISDVSGCSGGVHGCETGAP